MTKMNKVLEIKENLKLIASNLSGELNVLVKSFVEKSKDLKKTNYDLGIFHLEKGNLADAKFRFKFVLKFDSNYKDALYQLARSYIYNLQINKAAAILQKIPANENVGYRLKLINNDIIDHIPNDVIKEDFNFLSSSKNIFINDLQHLGPELLSERLFNLLQKTNNSDLEIKNLLDLGCGSGEFGLELRSKLNIKYIVGIDLSNKMLNNATKIYDNVQCLDFKNLSQLSKKKYDLISACNSLHYIKDLEEILISISTFLSDNGYFAFIVEGTGGENDFNYSMGNFRFNKEYIKNTCSNMPYEIMILEEININDKEKGICCIIKKI